MDGNLTPLKGAVSHCGCNSGSIQHNTWDRGGVVVGLWYITIGGAQNIHYTAHFSGTAHIFTSFRHSTLIS